MKDLRRYGDNYRTRETRIAVSTPASPADGNELILFKLPRNSLFLGAFVCVEEADETSGATIDIVAVPAIPKPTFADFTNSDVVLADEIAIDSVGVKGCNSCDAKLLDKEYIIGTRNGITAGTGASFSVIIQFLELTTKGDDGLLAIPMIESDMILE